MCDSSNAQLVGKLTDEDKTALEAIIVEKYALIDSKEIKDTVGGNIPKKSITYRIYVDLKPGYSIQAVFGVPNHKLTISSTTSFFNNVIDGNATGDKIYSQNLNKSSVAYDSWLTIGAATESHQGVPLDEDIDGSIIKSSCFKKADGIKIEKIKPITFFGIDPIFFNSRNSGSSFTTDNGSWAIFGGMKGVTSSNKILIAQLTTDGQLSYELNIQIGTPKGSTIQFVSKNPENNELLFEGLRNTQ